MTIRYAGSATTTTVTSTANFSYVPVTTCLSPAFSPVAGGELIILTGSGFTEEAGSAIVQVGAQTASVTFQSNTQIVFISPASDTDGPADVTVTVGSRTSSPPLNLLYLPAPTPVSGTERVPPALFTRHAP